MNPLDQAGQKLDVALCKPICRVGKGPSFRVSFEVTEETFNSILRAKDSSQLILQGSLMAVGVEKDVVGGFYSNIAGMMCSDSSFYLFLQSRANMSKDEIEKCDFFRKYDKLAKARRWNQFSRDYICKTAKVTSRKYLDHSLEARELFRELVREFADYCRAQGFRTPYLAVALSE